jgi:hypothetical protein
MAQVNYPANMMLLDAVDACPPLTKELPMTLFKPMVGLVLLVFLSGPFVSLQAGSLPGANTIKGGPATPPTQPGVKDGRTPAVPQVTPRPAVTRQAPMLEIKRVYVFAKDHKLRVVIGNTGGGLSSKAYMAGRLEVTLMGTATRWEWPLASINPQRNHFKPDTTFNTGKRLTESTRVMVRITRVSAGKPWIGYLPEDETARAKAASVPSMPQAPPQAPTFRSIQKPGSVSSAVGQAPAQPVQRRAPNTQADAGAAAPVPIQRPEMVPKGPVGDGNFHEISDHQLLDNTVAQNLANPSVTLLAPNGGEEWGRGSMKEIVWQTFPGDRERRWEVAYTKGFEQRVVINDPFTYDAASGTYRLPWFIANDMREGSGYGVRVQEVSGPRFDHSDEAFSIVEPRGGDLRLFVEADLEQYVVVRGIDSEPRLRIRWRGDEEMCQGSTATMAVRTASGELIQRMPPVRGVTCNGETEVIIPDRLFHRLQNEAFYVSVHIPPSSYGASGTIDYAASRPRPRHPLEVNSPSSGDNIIPGSTGKIYWRDGNPSVPTTSNREFWLLISHTERRSIPVDTMHYDKEKDMYYMEWYAGTHMSLSGGHQGSSVSPYAIQIRATDSGQESTGGNFSVWDQGLEIVIPVENAVYYSGNYLPIRWNNTATSDGRLELYLMKPDRSRIEIDNNVDPIREQTSWLIPASFGPGQYKLSIRRSFTFFGPEGADGYEGAINYGFYESETFEIRKPSLTLMQPTRQDGVVYAGDLQVPIIWDHEGFDGGTLGTKIRINLYRNSQLIGKIADVAVRAGQYLWRAGRTASNPYGHIEITSSAQGEATDPATGTRFQILIELKDDENVFDRSGYFEIR